MALAAQYRPVPQAEAAASSVSTAEAGSGSAPVSHALEIIDNDVIRTATARRGRWAIRKTSVAEGEQQRGRPRRCP